MLQIADPEDGCSPLKSPEVKGDWIALVLRSEKDRSTCSFDVKVSSLCHQYLGLSLRVE